FAAAPAPTEFSTTDTATFAFYDGNDGEIALALKMLGKKDALTKTKALVSLKDTILPSRKPIELRNAIGHYCYLYSKLMTENDRRVRQLSNEVLVGMLEKMKKATVFHQHIALLLPTWFILAMQDPHVDTCKLALRSFQILFPSLPEQQAVVTRHIELLLTSIRQYLVAKVDDLSDRAIFSADEAEERYERMVTSTLLSFARLVEMLSTYPDAKPQYEDGGLIASLATSTVLSRMTAVSSKSPTFSRTCIRQGAYKALTAVITHSKMPLDPKVILGVFQEKVASNHDAMWTLVLSYIKQQSTLPWTSLHSIVFPRFLALLKHGFYGSGSSSYANVLPFIASIPCSIATSHNFYSQLLSAIWKGLDTNYVFQAENDVVVAFLECLSAICTILVTSDSPDFAFKFQPAEFVQSTFGSVLTHVLTSANYSTLSDRAFSSLSKNLFLLLPRVNLYHEGRVAILDALEDQTKANWIQQVMAVQESFILEFHNALNSALLQCIQKDLTSTVFLPERLVSLMANAKSAYTKQGTNPLVEEHLYPLVQRIYQAAMNQIDIEHPHSRPFLVLAQLLDVFGQDVITTSDEQYTQILAPCFVHLQQKVDYFKVFSHYLQTSNNRKEIWFDLATRMDQLHSFEDVLASGVALRTIALRTPDVAPNDWELNKPPPNAIWTILWESQWFDKKVNQILIEGAIRQWNSMETTFLSSCWADPSVPIVTRKTFESAILFCESFHLTQPENAITLLESLLPHLEADPRLITLILHIIHVTVDPNVIPTTAHAARCLWSETLRPRIVSFWSLKHKESLASAWAGHLNTTFTTENPVVWAGVCGEYLSLHSALRDFRLFDKLTVLQEASYRQLECLAEICHWQSGTLLDYLIASVDVTTLYKWIYLDIGFALTWFVVDASHVTPREMLHVSKATWLESYAMLSPLYDALSDTPHITSLVQFALESIGTLETPLLQCILTTHIEDPALKSSTILKNSPIVDRRCIEECVFEWLLDSIPCTTALKTLKPSAYPKYSSILAERYVDAASNTSIRIDDSLFASAANLLLQNPFDGLISDGADVIAMLPLGWANNNDLVVNLLEEWSKGVKNLYRPLTVKEWGLLCDAVIALLPLTAISSVVQLASQLFSMVFSAKQEQSDIVGLKVHATIVSNDKEFVRELFTTRSKLLSLVNALSIAEKDHMDLELARHHRDALFQTMLRTIADCLVLKPTYQTLFVQSNDPNYCLKCISHAIDVERGLATGLLYLANVLKFVDLPAESAATMILQACNGRDLLWDAMARIVVHPSLKAAIYTLLRATNLEVNDVKDAVNVQADDEEATEAAVIDLIVTPGLTNALESLHSIINPSSAEAVGMFLLWDL
ncbi:hypothetical protein THRCLA_11891, partial [Thraustotheca clavata]